jgi:hypothetical protein
MRVFGQRMTSAQMLRMGAVQSGKFDFIKRGSQPVLYETGCAFKQVWPTENHSGESL